MPSGCSRDKTYILERTSSSPGHFLLSPKRSLWTGIAKKDSTDTVGLEPGMRAREECKSTLRREAWQRDSRRGEGQDVAREQCGQGDGSQVWGNSTWWLVSRETRLILTPTSNQRIDWKKTYDTRRAHHSPSFSSESKTSVWS